MTGSGGEDGPARPPIALTPGEPAGICGELTLMAWREATAKHQRNADTVADPLPGFFAIDDPRRLEALARRLGLSVPIRVIGSAADALPAFDHGLPVLPLEFPAPVKPGQPDPANAPAVLEAIERAVALVKSGEAAAIVTNPVHKHTLYSAGFRHPGHTEYLAELAGTSQPPVMMLACPALRVVPVTVHQALRQALDSLSAAAIVHAGRVTAAALAGDFGIARPRLAVAGVNPHAGEDGALGREEIEIIAPALAELNAAGIDATGPAPPDTLFHPRAREGYDAALCMYHDQALIPLKTIDVEHGVNVTLGLPFVRTSPDHGTALRLAGQGTASPASLIAALALAGRMADARMATRQRAIA